MASKSILSKIAIALLLCQTSWALRPSQFGPGSGQNPNLPSPPSHTNTHNAYNANANVNAYEPPPAQDYDYGHIPSSPMETEHESVEERLERWRQQQQYKYENQSPIDAANPRQEDGKMKLLASVSKGSIAMFFFILMWRAVHHYEMADLAFTGTARLFMVIPPVILFLGNMAGCVGSITSSGSLGKKRMKGILNLNKFVEIVLMAYNVSRLILVPSKLVPREVFVGRTLSNFLFLVQCQVFTKVTWNTTLLKPATDAAERVYGNIGGDDYEQDYNTGAYEQNYQTYEDDDAAYQQGYAPNNN